MKKKRKKNSLMRQFLESTVDQCKWLSQTGFSNWSPTHFYSNAVSFGHLNLSGEANVNCLRDEKTWEIKLRKKKSYVRNSQILAKEMLSQMLFSTEIFVFT